MKKGLYIGGFIALLVIMISFMGSISAEDVTENDDPRFLPTANIFPRLIDHCTSKLQAHVILVPLCRLQGDLSISQRVLAAVMEPSKVSRRRVPKWLPTPRRPASSG